MDYREPRRLGRALQIMSAIGGGLSGLCLVLLLVFYAYSYSLNSTPEGGPGLGAFGFAVIFILFDSLLNLIAQIPLVLWARRIALNNGLSGTRMLLAFIIPLINLIAPAIMLSRLATRLSIRSRTVVVWWLVKLASSLWGFMLASLLLGVGSIAAQAKFPLQFTLIFGYFAVVSLARNGLGWQLIGRMSRADRAANRAEIAISAF